MDFGPNDSFDFNSLNIVGSNNSLIMDNKDIAVLLAIYPCLRIDTCHILPKINIVDFQMTSN